MYILCFKLLFRILSYIWWNETFFCLESRVGGWVDGLRSPEDMELAVEEAEDVSQNPNFEPSTPTAIPSALSRSQTKT